MKIHIEIVDEDGAQLLLSTFEDKVVLAVDGKEVLIPITTLQHAFQALSYATPEEDEDDDEI